MSRPALTISLVVLALLPIAVWAYTAYGFALSYQMTEAGSRKTGQAAAILLLILAGLTPAFIGGILMVVGATLLGRRPTGARVTASVGIGLVLVTLAVGLISEVATAHYSMLIAALAYLLVHAAIIVWLWRGRRRAAL